MRRENSAMEMHGRVSSHGHAAKQQNVFYDARGQEENVFYDARESLGLGSHPLGFGTQHHQYGTTVSRKHTRAARAAAGKQPSWEKTLGKYTPGHNYTHYKKVYNKEVREAAMRKNAAALGELRGAWTSFRKNITQSKRLVPGIVRASNEKTGIGAYHAERAALKRQFLQRVAEHPAKKQAHLQTYREARARLAVQPQYKRGLETRARILTGAKHHALDTGRVALPPVTMDLKQLVEVVYDTLDVAAKKFQRKSLCKVLQEGFYTHSREIAELAIQSASAQRHLGGWASGFAGVACAAALPFLPGVVVSAVATVIGAQAALFAQHHSPKLAPVIQHLGAAANPMLNVMIATINTVLAKIPQMGGGCISERVNAAAGPVIEAALKLLFRYYLADVELDVTMLLKVLNRHRDTIQKAIGGQDVSLKTFFRDCVDAIAPAHKKAVQEALQQKYYTKYVFGPGAPGPKKRGRRA